MKILREFIDPMVVENKLVEENGEKNVYIHGIFAQGDIINKNKRYYSKGLLEREMYKLQKMIVEGKLIGALDHPQNPEIRLEDAAILITQLSMDGNNVIGEAKILKETPKGAVAFGLAKGGVKMGTSTRGLGSLDEKEGVMYVKEDFNWLTNDLVGDPSAPDAWVNCVLEKQEFYIDGGYIKEDVMASYKNQLRNLPKGELEEGLIKLFQQFLGELK